MKSEISNPQSEILPCPCPIDHRIVEAVTTWAQTSDPVARQTAWSAVVDIMNRKTWDAQIANMPQGMRSQIVDAASCRVDGLESGHAKGVVNNDVCPASRGAASAGQPPY